jgi:predicted O-methyltransferase YrrM
MDQASLSASLQEIHAAVRDVEGFLSKTEIDFLALLAALPTAAGQILEIGSFRGRSTIVLAKAARLGDAAPIAAVDPLPDTDALYKLHLERGVARSLLEQNLRRAGVREQIEVHQMLSRDLRPSWNRPLRLLWIDGDHCYESARDDLAMFAPFLSDGAIVAFHDVLHPFTCIRAYRESVVDSRHFGAVGLVGSIGWGQFFKDPSCCEPFFAAKRKVSRKLRTLERFNPDAVRSNPLTRMLYRLGRWQVPHGPMSVQRWRRLTTTKTNAEAAGPRLKTFVKPATQSH